MKTRSVFRIENADIPYTMIYNALLQDKRMSWEERGLLADLLSRKDDYEISVSGIAKMDRESKGRNKIYSLLEVPILLGYIEKGEEQNLGGKFKTVVYRVYGLPRENRALIDGEHNKPSVSQSGTRTCLNPEHEPCLNRIHNKTNKKKTTKAMESGGGGGNRRGENAALTSTDETCNLEGNEP